MIVRRLKVYLVEKMGLLQFILNFENKLIESR